MSYWMMLRRKRLIAACGINVAALDITYSAANGMTDEIVTMADGEYRLLTLTKSGTLTVPTEVTADVWLCGGGAHGVNHSSYGGYGGGGGFVASSYGLNVKEVVATVGAAAGATSFMDVSANGASGKNGGSGGGGNYWGGSSSAGTGAGVSTYPFEDTTYFSGKPHCAGGGGGGTYINTQCTCGGAGGSNGSAGSQGIKTSHDYYGGAGGLYGGGHGCSASSDHSGRKATFYGGGGGGRGSYERERDTEYDYTARGNGYQGVIYVRIPLKQPA